MDGKETLYGEKETLYGEKETRYGGKESLYGLGKKVIVAPHIAPGPLYPGNHKFFKNLYLALITILKKSKLLEKWILFSYKY